MSLYQRQREEVRQTILATSISVFRKKGFQNATIEEITKEVGIAKGTFYNFYTSKREILMAWAKERFIQLDLEKAMNKEKTIEENLKEFINILVREIDEDLQLFHSFLLETLKNHDNTKDKDFDFLSIYKAIITNSCDSIRATSSLLEEKVDVLNSSLFMGIINWLASNESSRGLKEYLMKVLRICLYGFYTD